MNKGSENVLIMASADDLQRIIDENVGMANLQAFINRFYNVLVGTKEVAKLHCVSERTVLNYIKDGLLIPEMKTGEKAHPKFRMSYVLTIDFKKLQTELRAKNKGWK